MWPVNDPCGADDEKGVEKEPSSAASAGSGKLPLILVCEDEPHIRHIVVMKLRESGFEVMEGRDGAEGLRLAEARTPDLVITDFQMPGVSGLAMAQELKRRSATSRIPVLMLTARGYVLSDTDLAQTNVVQVIGKPFGVRQLLGRVVDVLARGLEDSSRERRSARAA